MKHEMNKYSIYNRTTILLNLISFHFKTQQLDYSRVTIDETSSTLTVAIQTRDVLLLPPSVQENLIIYLLWKYFLLIPKVLLYMYTIHGGMR